MGTSLHVGEPTGPSTLVRWQCTWRQKAFVEGLVPSGKCSRNGHLHSVSPSTEGEKRGCAATKGLSSSGMQKLSFKPSRFFLLDLRQVDGRKWAGLMACVRKPKAPESRRARIQERVRDRKLERGPCGTLSWGSGRKGPGASGETRVTHRMTRTDVQWLKIYPTL